MMKFHDICRHYESYYVKKKRLTYSKAALNKKIQTVRPLPLPQDLLRQVDDYWNRWHNLGKTEHQWFDFYHALRPDDRVEWFIPNNLYYSEVDLYFNHHQVARAYDDKNMYDLLLCDAPRPKTVLHCMRGSFLDPDYAFISIDEAVERCFSAKNVIIKPAVGTDGGKGILFWQDDMPEARRIIREWLNSSSYCVAQEIVRQHPALSKLHESSINTIRILTFCLDSDVHVLSSLVRMGVGDSRVDNVSAGGIACGIDSDGQLKEKAYNAKGQVYTSHPGGTVFAGCFIPGFDRCTNLVKRLAPRFARFSKLVSWDIALQEDGDPVIIEVNLSYGQIDFHQMCNGPVFGDLTDRVLDMVFHCNERASGKRK